MRALVVATSLLSLAGLALAQPAIDGVGINSAAYGASIAVQNTNTQFGDNQNELNQLFVTSDSLNVYIGIPGNMADNNGLMIFIDTTPGNNPAGEVLVDTSAGACPGALPTLLRMHSNLTFDPGFDPDYAMTISVGRFPGQSSNNVFASNLTNLVALTDVSLGLGFDGSGNGLISGSAVTGVEIAINSSNTIGVDGWDVGNETPDPGQAEGPETGIEIKIPKSQLGFSGSRTISLFAYLSNNAQDGGVGPCSRSGWGSNQALPGVGGIGNLGPFNPPAPLNFTTVAGTQWVSVGV